jgi:hypothetical protein
MVGSLCCTGILYDAVSKWRVGADGITGKEKERISRNRT